MGSEWENVILRDVTTLRNGAGVKQEYFSESGIPLVRVSDFTMNSIDIQNCNYVEKQHAKKWETHLLNEKDILVATVGSWPPNWSSVVGKVIRTPESARGAIQNQNTCCVVPIKEVLDNDYLYYRLKSEDFSWHTSNNAGGSANQARLPVKKLGEFTFLLPPLDYQKRIGSSLAILDNKIQLNRETNQTLEAMAQALFKSWFVDFDPVFDNIIAHNLAHNNAPLHNIPEPLLPHAQRRLNVHNVGRGSARQTASQEFHHLFPQAFEQSDEPSVGIQGWVPKGWGVDGLGSFINFSNGKLMKSTVDGLYPLYGANGIIGKTNEIRCSNAIIIGRVGAYCGAIKYCPSSFWPSDNTIVASSTESEDMLPFILYQLKYLNLNQYAGGAAQPLLNQATLKSIKVSAPSRSACNVFNKTVSEFIIKSTNLENEIHVLESLRDTLLPKLISGELRIPDAEQVSEALAK